MNYYYATWNETRRESINRFGRLGYVQYACAGVVEAPEGAKMGKAYYAPDKARGALLRLSNATLTPLPGKPRKNAKIWKECGEWEGDTLCAHARDSEARRYGRKWY